MDGGKFVLAGEDKEMLIAVKDILVKNGHMCIGFTKERKKILQVIKKFSPDFIVIEVSKQSFGELIQVLEVLDSDAQTAVVLILEHYFDEAIDFIRDTRLITYISKPVYEEPLVQVAAISLQNIARIKEYEDKVRQVNELLESRKIIERAKWKLVEKRSMTEAEAYEFIRSKSRNNRITMKKVAEAICLLDD